jgi:hypothetical protein
MAISRAPVGRIRDVAAQIKALEDRLMSNKIIPMSEQAIIHAEIRLLKKEQETLEKRTR